MARRRRKKVPQEPIQCDILNLSHEGRGIAKLEGKTQFVEGALAGDDLRPLGGSRAADADHSRGATASFDASASANCSVDYA